MVNKYKQIESKSDDTRNRIYEVALALIREQGADSLTVRKIADGANVSPALIIQYFGSKDRLLSKVFESRDAKLVEDITAWYEALGETCLHEMLLEISGFVLRRDLEYPSLTLQVMCSSFTWTREQEAEFMQRLNPLVHALVLAITKVAHEISASKAETLSRVFLMVYTQSCRIIIQRGMTLEEGLDFLRPMLQLIEDGAINSVR